MNRIKHTLSPRKMLITLVLLIAILPWLPLGASSDYLVRIATTTLLYMILALGLNIVPGFTGLLDLGYVGFYGIGAYTAGLLIVHYQISFWLVLPIAALNGMLWGILLGTPTLRLTGDYFAIVTFGFSELVVLVLRNELWLTRGPMGLPGILPPQVFGHIITNSWEFLYIILLLLMVVLTVVTTLEDSRIGRAWFAIREDEIAAQCSGINLIRYKVTAFAISASIGAAGGAFFASWFKFIHPDMFKFWESILIFCLIVFGGMGSIAGTMIGALALIPLTEVLRVVLPQELFSARYLIYGLVLVLMMRWRPNGLFPFERAQVFKTEQVHKRLALQTEQEAHTS